MKSGILLALAVIGAAAPGVLCDRFIILSSATSNCPGELTGEVCVTLEQYVYNPSQSSEITLLLQPGQHRLPANFLVSGSTRNFSMISDAEATIACNTRSLILTLTSVEYVNITGVSFKGCGGFLIDGSVRVYFANVAITNTSSTTSGYALQITAPLAPNPSRSVTLHNVTFLDNSHGSSIMFMYHVVFDHVTYINSKLLTVVARDGSITTGSQIGARHNGPQTTFTMTQSLYSHNDYEMWLNVDKGYISNCTFTDNGGTYWLFASQMNLTVEDSVFSHNRGGLTGHGTNLTMNNCTFSSNADRALSITGAYFLKLQKSTFVNNAGGLHFLGLAITVTDCTFDSNRATYGGAIFASPLYHWTAITSRNVFVNNSATVDGGALHYSGQMPYSNAFIRVYSTDDLFLGNNASVSGGAVYCNTSSRSVVLSVRNSTFRNNNAVSIRGGALYSAGVNTVLSLVDSTFDSNSAPSCGVMDVSNHVAVHVNSSSFTDNVATAGVFGGGVACIRNAHVSIRDATFTYNRANLHAGVLYVDGSSVSILDSTFLGNSAAANGGVIYTRVVSAEYSISHSAFSYNSAGQSGGVMYLNREGSRATVTESIISFNRAAERGGAFSVIGSSLNITGSNIFNNTANLGNAVSACNSVVEVQQLNSSLDSAHPSCELYEGFVDIFDIVPPHNFNSLTITTTPQSSPSTTSSPPSTSDHSPMNNSSPTDMPLLTSTPPNTGFVTSTPTPSSTTTTFPYLLSTVQSRQQKEELLVIIIIIFAVIIVVLLLCVIALAVKVIYDCVQRRSPQYHQVQSISLGAVNKLP